MVLCLKYACKNHINRNKKENITKYDNENKDFMPFIQTGIMDMSSGNYFLFAHIAVNR